MASTTQPPGSSRWRLPFHCCTTGLTESLKKLSPMPRPRLVLAPLTGLSTAPKGRLKPLGKGLLRVARIFVLSVETTIGVVLWNPSVPELPEVPAACNTEGEYISAYAP